MGLVGWILLGILGIAFSFFGLSWYFQSNTRINAAVVNDVEISTGEHQRAYQILRNRMQGAMGESYNPALIDEGALKKSALEQLINEELLLQETNTSGFAVSDQLVAAQINAVEAFREDGIFSKARYERALRLQGMSPPEFEWRLAREKMAQQLRRGIILTAAPTEKSLDTAYRLQAQQRSIRYLVVPTSRFENKVAVTDEDVAAHYDNHGDQFMVPERIRLQYIELTAAEVDTGSEVSEEDLRALYEEQSERFTTEEERRARHILISVPPDASMEAVEEARQKAEPLLARLETGESFKELAGSSSDDPGSAANGGDLGFFGKGLMAPAFEEAVYGLEKGGRSGIVRSPFGFHIIELTDIKPGSVTPLEEVRAELTEALLSKERGELFFEQSETLATLAYENPDNLETPAAALGLAIKTSDWLTGKGGEGIGKEQRVIDAAFSEDVLKNGNNSELLELGDEHAIVARILEHEEARREPLENVREEVAGRVRDVKLQVLVKEYGATLLEALKSGTDIGELAKEQGLDLTEPGYIARNTTNIDRTLLGEVFLLPYSAEGKPTVAGFSLPTGNYALVSLDDVKDASIAALPESARKRVQLELARIQGITEMAAIMDSLRSKAVIVIPEPSN